MSHSSHSIVQLFRSASSVIYVASESQAALEEVAGTLASQIEAVLSPEQAASFGDVEIHVLRSLGTVAEIRTMLQSSYTRPYVLPYKLTIIVLDAPFKEQSQQLFLKAIEDATEFQRFLFITVSEATLMQTIRSRSVIVYEGKDEAVQNAQSEEEEALHELARNFTRATPVQRKKMVDSELQAQLKELDRIREFIEALIVVVHRDPLGKSNHEMLNAIEKCREICHTTIQKNLIIHSLQFIPTLK